MKGRPDFDSHKIVRVIQAAVAIFITRIEPVGSDNREQHVTLGDLLTEHLDKVDPQRDGVDVHKQEVAAELPFQPIVHSASVARAIVTAIADEDLSRHYQMPGETYSKNTILSNGPHFARLFLGPHVSYFTFSPSMAFDHGVTFFLPLRRPTLTVDHHAAGGSATCWLPPWMVTRNRFSGHGCRTRGNGKCRSAIFFISDRDIPHRRPSVPLPTRANPWQSLAKKNFPLSSCTPIVL